MVVHARYRVVFVAHHVVVLDHPVPPWTTEVGVLSIDERVAAGAAWLDEHRPGWVDRIDLNTLDLGDGCYCILGQTDGYFWDVPEVTSLYNYADVFAELGLFAAGGIEGDAEYSALTEAWRRLITARRNPPPSCGAGCDPGRCEHGEVA
jgi:hypothetical protein